MSTVIEICETVFFKIAPVKTFFEYSVDYIWNQDDRSSEIGNHIPYPYSWLHFQSQFWILSAMKKLTAIKNNENLVKLFLLEDLIKIDSLKYLLIESCNCTENSFFLNFDMKSFSAFLLQSVWFFLMRQPRQLCLYCT